MSGHQPRPPHVLPPFDNVRSALRAVGEDLGGVMNMTVVPPRGWHPLIPLPWTPRSDPTTIDCWTRSPIHLHQLVRCLALLFLAALVLIVVGGGMQAEETAAAGESSSSLRLRWRTLENLGVSSGCPPSAVSPPARQRHGRRTRRPCPPRRPRRRHPSPSCSTRRLPTGEVRRAAAASPHLGR